MKIIAAIPFLALAPGLWASQPPSGTDKAPDWTPPKTTVAKELVEVGKFLLEHGMGDPRGGIFGKATKQVELLGYPQPRKKDYLGWSVGEGKTKRFVTLRGTVFPVVTNFKPLAIDDEVAKACALVDKGVLFDGSRPLEVPFPQDEESDGIDGPERLLLSDQAVVLLLVHGDIPQAERLFSFRKHRVYDSMASTTKQGLDELAVSEILHGFMEDLWNHAVAAHMSGDDDVAARACNLIEANRAQLETLASKEMDFSFLNQTGVLLRDSERRIKEKPVTIDLDEVRKLGQKERIAKYIELLDGSRRFVHGFEMSLGGSDMSPYTGLFKEGEAAGDQLLDCIEKDSRLSRTVFSSSANDMRYTFKTVRDEAMSILNRLCQVDEFRYGSMFYSPFEKAPDIKELRAKWSALKGLTEPQRWLWVLRNDETTVERWIRAAQGLTAIDYSRQSGSKRPMRWESLSKNEQDEFRSLLIRRIKQLEQRIACNPPEPIRLYAESVSLAYCCLLVDKQIGLSQIRKIVAKAWDSMPRTEPILDSQYQFAFAKAFYYLAEDGDAHARKAYLDWLRLAPQFNNITANHDPYAGLAFCTPDEAEAAVEALVANPRFALNRARADKDPLLVHRLFRTALLEYLPFRRAVAKLLSDDTIAGTFKKGPDGYLNVESLEKGDKRWAVGSLAPKAEKDSTCRFGDIVAMLISSDFPERIDVAWANSRKDEAKANLVKVLNQDNSQLKPLFDRFHEYRKW